MNDKLCPEGHIVHFFYRTDQGIDKFWCSSCKIAYAVSELKEV